MKTKFDAILKIKPDAQITEANGVVSFNDGNPTNITEQQIETKLNELLNQEDTTAADRTNAINKLKGATYSALTDAEAKALFGE